MFADTNWFGRFEHDLKYKKNSYITDVVENTSKTDHSFSSCTEDEKKNNELRFGVASEETSSSTRSLRCERLH